MIVVSVLPTGAILLRVREVQLSDSFGDRCRFPLSLQASDGTASADRPTFGRDAVQSELVTAWPNSTK
jgi:hypothetical protein